MTTRNDLQRLLQVQVPTKLIVGSDCETQRYAQTLLQLGWCTQQHESAETLSGCFCTTCRMIKNRQHHALYWLTPEKAYTVADIDTILDLAKFALDADQRFFFVLDQAHTLTTATANRLLKLLEEPPAGYHFLLLTNNKNALLPTILSRSYVIQLKQDTDVQTTHPLLAFFMPNTMQQEDPFAFEQALKKYAPSENESIELINNLCQYVMHEYKKAMTQPAALVESEYLSHLLLFLQKKLEKPPQPGSSHLFWRMLYLTCPRSKQEKKGS